MVPLSYSHHFHICHIFYIPPIHLLSMHSLLSHCSNVKAIIAWSFFTSSTFSLVQGPHITTSHHSHVFEPSSQREFVPLFLFPGSFIFPLLKILLRHHSLCCVYIKDIVLENNLSWGLQEKCIRRVRAGFGARIASFLRKSTKYNWWWSQNDFVYLQDFWWLRLV